MEYELGKKVRLVREYCRVPAGSVGEITSINGYDDVQPIRVDFGRGGKGWPPVGAFELIEEQPEVDLTKIDTPFGLLDEDTQQRLRDWPHGIERLFEDGWDSSVWNIFCNQYTYRAKPAPERKTVWMNPHTRNISSLLRWDRDSVDKWGLPYGTAIWRIEYNEDGSDPKIFVEDV